MSIVATLPLLALSHVLQPARPLRAPVPPIAATRCSGPRCNLSTDDPRVLTADIDRVTGIDFGSDLTLRWPYVLGLVPNGAAERSGLVKVGDQLVAIAGQSVLGLSIGDAMEKLGTAEGETVALTFFRGTRDQLQDIVGWNSQNSGTVTITVQEPGKPEQQIQVPYGANLRDELIDRKINVYQSITRWTNCNGQQLCGTCIVNVPQGLEACTRRSLDEDSTLRENPPTYKLACITNVYGDITVQLLPKIMPAQWTR